MGSDSARTLCVNHRLFTRPWFYGARSSFQDHTCYGVRFDRTRLVIAMLTAYFDESGIMDDQQLCIVAGFIGNEAQWGSFASDWIAAIKPRPHLHMKKLRWRQHPDRVAEDLARYGPIPHKYNLKPVWAGMWHS